jgi:hypothetical protein
VLFGGRGLVVVGRNDCTEMGQTMVGGRSKLYIRY